MAPLVSIIIPCYNQARFLPDALDSVLAQTLTDWECIVVNDGSDDDTCDVATRYEKLDPRFLLVSQVNRGLAGARNTGIDKARGRYIQFLDADDAISPNKLALQVAALSQANSSRGISYTDYRYCPEQDILATTTRDNFSPPRFIHARRLHDIALRWESEFSIPCHCFLFDAFIFYECGIRFDESLPNHEDWDCWMRIFALDPEVYHIDGSHAIYRLHGASMCVNKQKMWFGFSQAIDKQLKLHSRDRHMQSILKRKYKERRLAYGIPTLFEVFKLNVEQYFTRLIRKAPWPIQRFIRKILATLHVRQGNS